MKQILVGLIVGALLALGIAWDKWGRKNKEKRDKISNWIAVSVFILFILWLLF